MTFPGLPRTPGRARRPTARHPAEIQGPVPGQVSAAGL